MAQLSGPQPLGSRHPRLDVAAGLATANVLLERVELVLVDQTVQSSREHARGRDTFGGVVRVISDLSREMPGSDRARQSRKAQLLLLGGNLGQCPGLAVERRPGICCSRGGGCSADSVAVRLNGGLSGI